MPPDLIRGVFCAYHIPFIHLLGQAEVCQLYFGRQSSCTNNNNNNNDDDDDGSGSSSSRNDVL